MILYRGRAGEAGWLDQAIVETDLTKMAIIVVQ
jgi:hypothetical protein